MSSPRSVVIVGAGIAGLTSALSLARRGIPSIILERASHLEEVGAGIQLSPNASRILIDLGLGPALERVAVRPQALVIHNAAAAREVLRLPLGASIESRYGAPYWVVHRGDLQSALLDAVAREPLVTLRLGCSVETVRTPGEGVAVDAFVGAEHCEITGDALIGADGVWSHMRTRVLGGEPSVFSGRTAWRATFPAQAWAGDPAVRTATGLWLGTGAHLVHYPIRAGREINVVAIIQEDWIDERWDVFAHRSDLDAAFSKWPKPVRDLLALPESWRKWALFAAPRSTPWTSGPTALIGDAVHAMLPFVAQGGAMAIEDAAVLADRLAVGEGTVPARLAAYASARKARVRSVADTARRNARIYHLSGPAAACRDAVMRLTGAPGMISRMDWIWGWRAPAVPAPAA